MCLKCFEVIKDMDIRDSDLPNLPFTMVKWHCLVPGCKAHTKVRDYGLVPFYYWPVKVRYYKDGKWRGGWLENAGHWYLCSKHWKPVVSRQIPCPDHSEAACISKFVKIDKQTK